MQAQLSKPYLNFKVWTDRVKKEDIAYMDLEVGKYGKVKMAVVHLAHENQMYFKFNTESTALFLEFVAHLWNMVYLELKDTGGNYEADYKEIDAMEDRKLPIQIVSVLRRNKLSTGVKDILIGKIVDQLHNSEEQDIRDFYAYLVESKRIKKSETKAEIEGKIVKTEPEEVKTEHQMKSQQPNVDLSDKVHLVMK